MALNARLTAHQQLLTAMMRRMHKTACATLSCLVLAVLATTAHAGQLPLGCEPPWAKACAPPPAGSATVEGIVHTVSSISYANIAIMYRTVEGSLGPQVGDPIYGSWQAVRTESSTGAFRLTLPACATTATSGCNGGGDYEFYAAYDGEPCTEMWYAKLVVDELDRLPSEALLCAQTSTSVSALSGGNEGFDGPTCKPYWARNCMPGTAGGTAHASGAISHPAADRPFADTSLALAYRTTDERAPNGSYVYGPTQYAKLSKDAFSLTLEACSPTVRVLGCDGGYVEAWPVYNHVACGKPITFGLLIATESENSNGVVCDTRGTLDVSLHVANEWHLMATSKAGKTFKTQGSEPELALLLMPGQYRIQASATKQCVRNMTVKIGIARTTHLRMRC